MNLPSTLILSIEANYNDVVQSALIVNVGQQKKARTYFHAIRIKISSITYTELLDFFQATAYCLQLVEDRGQSFTDWLCVKSSFRSVNTQYT